MPAPLASSVPSELASPTFRQRSPRSAAAAARAAGAAEEARSGSADSAAAHAAPPPAGAAPPALAATSLQLLHLQEVLLPLLGRTSDTSGFIDDRRQWNEIQEELRRKQPGLQVITVLG